MTFLCRLKLGSIQCINDYLFQNMPQGARPPYGGPQGYPPGAGYSPYPHPHPGGGQYPPPPQQQQVRWIKDGLSLNELTGSRM